MPSYAIRPFETLDEYRAGVRLQEEVWGAGFSERAPVSLMRVARRLGGIAAGAWDEEGGLAGFVFGLTGLEDGVPVHWSDMLAVRPGLRDGGLGARLKAYQRSELLTRGIRRCYWTFDPLESRNAWLNLSRLGVVVREYIPDMYGASDSPLHLGLGTDRFVALWLLDTPRVEERLAGQGRRLDGADLEDLPAALTLERSGSFAVPGAVRTGLAASRFTVPIPASIRDVAALDPGAASRWRSATREALIDALARGYQVTELVREGELSHYVLVQGTEPPGDPG